MKKRVKLVDGRQVVEVAYNGGWLTQDEYIKIKQKQEAELLQESSITLPEKWGG